MTSKIVGNTDIHHNTLESLSLKRIIIFTLLIFPAVGSLFFVGELNKPWPEISFNPLSWVQFVWFLFTYDFSAYIRHAQDISNIGIYTLLFFLIADLGIKLLITSFNNFSAFPQRTFYVLKKSIFRIFHLFFGDKKYSKDVADEFLINWLKKTRAGLVWFFADFSKKNTKTTLVYDVQHTDGSMSWKFAPGTIKVSTRNIDYSWQRTFEHKVAIDKRQMYTYKNILTLIFQRLLALPVGTATFVSSPFIFIIWKILLFFWSIVRYIVNLIIDEGDLAFAWIVIFRYYFIDVRPFEEIDFGKDGISITQQMIQHILPHYILYLAIFSVAIFIVNQFCEEMRLVREKIKIIDQQAVNEPLL